MSRRIVRLFIAIAFGVMFSAPLASVGNGDGTQIASRSQVTDRGVQVAGRAVIIMTGAKARLA